MKNQPNYHTGFLTCFQVVLVQVHMYSASPRHTIMLAYFRKTFSESGLLTVESLHANGSVEPGNTILKSHLVFLEAMDTTDISLNNYCHCCET